MSFCFCYPLLNHAEVWNGFMSKRGWRDESNDGLEKMKREGGFAHRTDIQTFFDFHEADEEAN